MPIVSHLSRTHKLIISLGIAVLIIGAWPELNRLVKNQDAPPVSTNITVVPTLIPTEAFNVGAEITNEISPPLATIPATINTLTPVIEQPTEVLQAAPENTATLETSDALLNDWLDNSTDNVKFNHLLVPVDIIRHFVVFVDNFAKGELSTSFSPLIKPAARFSAQSKNKKIYMSQQSYQRYNDYIAFINEIDTDTMMQFYFDYFSLFDKAYQEIGYEEGMFSYRLNQAINMALDTPVLTYPIEITSHTVSYKFAESGLEKLPAAQKFLLRIGPTNLQILQNKLLEIQNSLQQ